jgi:hypothetical protein
MGSTRGLFTKTGYSFQKPLTQDEKELPMINHHVLETF